MAGLEAFGAGVPELEEDDDDPDEDDSGDGLDEEPLPPLAELELGEPLEPELFDDAALALGAGCGLKGLLA